MFKNRVLIMNKLTGLLAVVITAGALCSCAGKFPKDAEAPAPKSEFVSEYISPVRLVLVEGPVTMPEVLPASLIAEDK